MSKLKKCQFNKKTLAFTLFLFVVFALLVYLFPYSGDDWAWGSSIGLDRLKANFENYNGRYAGNWLVLLLTRSELLNMVVTGVSLVCVCLFPKLFAESKSVLPYLFGTVLFFLLPKQIFVQAVVWTAGYSNYIPPILLVFGYFLLVKNLFADEPPRYSWLTCAGVTVIGFFASLFMENVTLYNVGISALLILFALFKFKRLFLAPILHFVGSVAGAVYMFTNSAYRTIASGSDGYRETALTGGLKETLVKQTEVIFTQFFRNNFVVLLIFSVLCAAVYLLYVRTSDNKKIKYAGLALLGLNVFSLFLIYSKSIFTYWEMNPGQGNSRMLTVLAFALAAALYFGSAVLLIFLCVKPQAMKWKLLLLLVSVPILIAPLVIVNPIGPRCFFPPYFMLIAACVLLFVHVMETASFDRFAKAGFAVPMLAATLSMLTFVLCIFSTIHTYDMKRNEYVQKQVEAGYTTVKVCKLPYGSYVWTGDPTSAPWDERYKLFYGVDEDVQFEFLSFSEFDRWAAEFDKEMSK